MSNRFTMMDLTGSSANEMVETLGLLIVSVSARGRVDCHTYSLNRLTGQYGNYPNALVMLLIGQLLVKRKNSTGPDLQSMLSSRANKLRVI